MLGGGGGEGLEEGGAGKGEREGANFGLIFKCAELINQSSINQFNGNLAARQPDSK